MERIAARLAEGRRHRLHELHPVMPVGGHEVLLLQKCRDGQEEVRGLGCVGHELVQADHEVEPRQRRFRGRGVRHLVHEVGLHEERGGHRRVGRAVQRGGDLGDRQGPRGRRPRRLGEQFGTADLAPRPVGEVDASRRGMPTLPDSTPRAPMSWKVW
jgi:hypothetical protein